MYSKSGGFMIVRGSMRYLPNGRRKKPFPTKQNRDRVQFMQLHREESVLHTKNDYPSHPMTPYKPQPRDDWKVQASSGYTIAPAYNKGAYQVISENNIEDIGK